MNGSVGFPRSKIDVSCLSLSFSLFANRMINLIIFVVTVWLVYWSRFRKVFLTKDWSAWTKSAFFRLNYLDCLGSSIAALTNKPKIFSRKKKPRTWSVWQSFQLDSKANLETYNTTMFGWKCLKPSITRLNVQLAIHLAAIVKSSQPAS